MQKHSKRVKENLELGELRQETDTKQCSLFHWTAVSSPRQDLPKKKLEQKKLSTRLSLRV